MKIIVFGEQRCKNSFFFIFGIYSLIYTLGFVQTKVVHRIFLFLSLFFGQKHFCLLGLNSDSRGWSLIMMGLISDNSVFTHKYTLIRLDMDNHDKYKYLLLKVLDRRQRQGIRKGEEEGRKGEEGRGALGSGTWVMGMWHLDTKRAV